MSHRRHGRFFAFSLFALLLSALFANGRITGSYLNSAALGDTGYEPEHSRSSSPQYFSELCNIENQILELEREGKEIPVLKLENSHFAPERHFLSKLKNKKSQRVILLDVGDYVIKSNGGGGRVGDGPGVVVGGGAGAPVIAVDIPAAPRQPPPANGVGGILRNSG